MAAKDFPVSLTIRAVDKFSRPLHAATQKLQSLTNNRIFKTFSRLGHDLSEFSGAAGFAAVGKGFSGVFGAAKKVGSEVFSLGARILGLASIAGFAFAHIIGGVVEAGDALGEHAQRWGVAADFAASFGHAAEQADVDQEQFNGSMDTFVKNVGQAKAGTGKLFGFLQKVSPELARQFKGSKSTEQALSLITSALERIEDPAKRAALSAAAFGAGNLQMGEFLHQGSSAIQGQMSDFLRLAGSQEGLATNAGALDNALKKLKTSFGGLLTSALVPLFPAFTRLSGIVSEFIVKNRDGIQRWAEGAAKAIQSWVDSGGFERLIENVRYFLFVAEEWWNRLGGLKTALAAVALVMTGPLIGALASMVPAIYSLGAALLTTPVGWFVLLVGALAVALWSLYDSGVFGALKDEAHGLSEVLSGLVTLDLGRVVRGWKEAMDGFKRSMTGINESVPDWLKVALGLVVPGAGGTFLAAKLQGASSAVPPAAGGANGTLTVAFENAPPGLRVSQGSGRQSVDTEINYSVGPLMSTP